MRTVIQSGPTVEPVSISEVKDQLRIFHAEHDATLLPRLITSARETVEAMTRRALITRTVDGYLDAFPCTDAMDLPFGQLSSVTYLKYTTDDNVEHTVDAATYYTDTISEPGRIVLKDGESWPDDELRVANGVNVRFVCGWATAAAVPASFKQAILLLVAHWYKNPEAALTGSVATLSAEIDFGVRNLLGLSSPLWI